MQLETISSAFYVVIIAALLRITQVFLRIGLLKWNEIRYKGKKLPPGTMGWPIIGETLDFLKLGPNFMKTKSARYGSLFKSHILGSPTIVSLDPEFNRYTLLNDGKGFVPGYPQSMVTILGKHNTAAVTGVLHKTIRSSMISLINSSRIKESILPLINEFMNSHLSNWSGKVIDIQQKTSDMAFLSSLKEIAGLETGPMSDVIRPEFFKLLHGTISLPINLPWTKFAKGLEGKKKIVRILEQLIAERKASGERKADMLDSLLNSDPESSRHLNNEQIIDLLVTVIHSGYETVSTTSMMAVKYLHDNPEALEELRNEHFSLRKNKDDEEGVTWNDYVSMEFTRAVIMETNRLATVVNGLMKKTTQDVEINGYIIPKGWKIYAYIREINYDPFIYEEPFTFNPWRWLRDKTLETQKSFLLFGAGGRLCPGKDIALVKISVFLHYLVTRYRWEEIQGRNKIREFPRVEAPNGLHFKFTSY